MKPNELFELRIASDFEVHNCEDLKIQFYSLRPTLIQPLIVEEDPNFRIFIGRIILSDFTIFALVEKELYATEYVAKYKKDTIIEFNNLLMNDIKVLSTVKDRFDHVDGMHLILNKTKLVNSFDRFKRCLDYAKENNAYVYFDKLMIKEEDLYDMRSSSV